MGLEAAVPFGESDWREVHQARLDQLGMSSPTQQDQPIAADTELRYPNPEARDAVTAKAAAAGEAFTAATVPHQTPVEEQKPATIEELRRLIAETDFSRLSAAQLQAARERMGQIRKRHLHVLEGMLERHHQEEQARTSAEV